MYWVIIKLVSLTPLINNRSNVYSVCNDGGGGSGVGGAAAAAANDDDDGDTVDGVSLY